MLSDSRTQIYSSMGMRGPAYRRRCLDKMLESNRAQLIEQQRLTQAAKVRYENVMSELEEVQSLNRADRVHQPYISWEKVKLWVYRVGL